MSGRVTNLGRVVDEVVEAVVVAAVVVVVVVVGLVVVVVVVVVVGTVVVVVVVVVVSGGNVPSPSLQIAPYQPSLQLQLPEAGSHIAPLEQAQEKAQFGPNFPVVQT